GLHPAGRHARRGRAPRRTDRVPPRRTARRRTRGRGPRRTRYPDVPQPPLRPPVRVGAARESPFRRRGRSLGAGATVRHGSGRAAATAGRVVAAARRAAVPEAGMPSLEQALKIAMRPREERLPDDHHPDFLHPGRTVLILLEDLGITDAAILSAGALA